MKRTKEKEEEILNFIRTGATNKDAAAMAGIDEKTFYRWMKKASFASQVNQARLANKHLHVARLQNAGANDWRAALAYLERAYPEEWGKKDEIKHTGKLSFFELFKNAPDENQTDKLISGENPQ